ncbi:YcaO-like family protein [Mycoplasmatota bacterium WC44]
MIRNNKYKDDSPINTVNRIKKILDKYDFDVEESTWKNSAEGFHSLRVTIEGTPLGTNGKGTTIEYAMASAYAELMERIQNQASFRLSLDLGEKAFNHKKFYYAPDEIYMSTHEFLHKSDEWTQLQMKLIKPHTNLPELLTKWKGVGYEDVHSDFVSVPFLNLMTDNLSYIPIKMISKMYMSNGMCAGNTIEEALVQGLSEVFERFVNIKILKENISPPTIPDKALKEYPRIYEMIKQIEAKGNFKVIMKDCSINKGYPVVSALFINRDEQTYFVKFGSHPIAEIAMERTLTELLQGQDVTNMMGVKEYSYNPPIHSKEDNIMGILINGSGFYPSELFSNKSSYTFKGFEKFDLNSNRELLIYLLNILHKENYNVFVRDYSYLGFPTYHVIVPGFSEVEGIDHFKSIEEYSKFVRVKKYIRNIIYLGDKEIKEMLSLMNELNIEGPTSVVDFLNIDISGEVPWYYTNLDLFKALSFFKLRDFKNSYKYFDIYLSQVQVNSTDKDIYTYYKCVRDYIGIRDKYSENMDCILEFSNFYKKEVIDDVIENYKESDNIFKKYGYINCFSCEKCEFINKCKYKNLERVYKTLKDANLENYKKQISMISELSL